MRFGVPFRPILVSHTSHVTCHTLQVTRHTSNVTRHTLHVTRHTSHVTRYTSHVTRHMSHVTRYTSHVTRHTSHVTRHTSHATGHPLVPSNKGHHFRNSRSMQVGVCVVVDTHKTSVCCCVLMFVHLKTSRMSQTP